MFVLGTEFDGEIFVFFVAKKWTDVDSEKDDILLLKKLNSYDVPASPVFEKKK